MAEWSIQEVGKTASNFFKKYPWLAWGGLALAGGAGIYYAYKRSRAAQEEAVEIPSYYDTIGAGGTTGELDAGALEQVMRELLEEQALTNRALLEELAREWQAGYTELAETVRSYLEAGAAAGAYLPRDYSYLYYAQGIPEEPVSTTRTTPTPEAVTEPVTIRTTPTPEAVTEPVTIPTTLAGTGRLYTERQARTILEWARMETKAQKAGYRGTSALPSGLAEAGLTVTYHPTGYVEFVPKGEKPSPAPPPAPGTPEYKLATMTEAERIGSAIAMLQQSWQKTTDPTAKQWYHQKAEELRQQAVSKGITQEVEKARLETWAALKET